MQICGTGVSVNLWVNPECLMDASCSRWTDVLFHLKIGKKKKGIVLLDVLMCYVMIKPGVSADCKVWKEAAISRNYSPHVSVSGRVEGRGRKPLSTELVSGIHLTPPAHRSLWNALVTNLQSAAFWNPSMTRRRWSSSISGSPHPLEGRPRLSIKRALECYRQRGGGFALALVNANHSPPAAELQLAWCSGILASEAVGSIRILTAS